MFRFRLQNGQEGAADAYDVKAEELHGEFAYLNNYKEPNVAN